MTVVRPKERPGFRLNPGKGWMLMMPGAGPEQFRDWPWVSLVYYRVNWLDLEPEEGRFAWDSPQWEGDFRRWIEAGYSVGLDVMVENPHGGEYCTPKWVRDAGCPGRYERRESGDPMHHGKVMDRWNPDYTSPIFQEKLKNFLTAFAARYDADPAVDFVTLRSYAAWGEWWRNEEPAEVLNWMVDLHVQLFRQTPLLIPVSSPQRWEKVILPAIDRGIGVRKDGLGGPIHPGEHALFDRAWLRAPCILEFWGPRDYLRGRGWDALFDKEECITAWHASRVNMGFVGQAKQWAEHEPDFLDRMAARMGYRFRLREAAFSERIVRAAGEKLAFQSWWRNDGIAPHTRPGALLLILRDSAGRETVVHEDTQFVNTITPVGHYEFKCEAPLPSSLPAGDYALLVALEDRFKGVSRPIRLAHEDDARGRVELGRITVM